jgi:8-oxo-dGTP pyrophosphatase MutT (NUDIX family)
MAPHFGGTGIPLLNTGRHEGEGGIGAPAGIGTGIGIGIGTRTEGTRILSPVTMSDPHDRLRSALRSHRPRRIPEQQKNIEAAVAVVVRGGDRGVEVLLIHRAEHPRDPWSGHMAFPGGRVDPHDDGPLAAAFRETREEIALDLETNATLLGRLSDATPRGRGRRLGFVIVPWVFELLGEPELRPNREVQEVVWVPLSFMEDRSNLATMWWRRGIFPIRLPCYRYRGHIIWGVTLRILDELVGLLGTRT